MIKSTSLLFLFISICSRVKTSPIETYTTTRPNPIRCKCSPSYCSVDSETDQCESESGICFMRLHEVEVDGKIVREVTDQGCLASGIERNFFTDVECDTSQDLQCCKEDLCNDVAQLTNPPTDYIVPATETSRGTSLNTMNHPPRRPPDQNILQEKSLTYPLYIVGVFVFLIAMILGGLLLLKFCKTDKEKMLVSNSMVTPLNLPHYIPTPQAFTPQDFTTSCSSGSGVPRLMEKTLIREITFCERIGKGRYGEVWRGRWRAGGQVAVKVFSNREEASWWHEAEMYQNYWLRHENILSFIGADQRDCVANMEYYLVLNYHPRGALYDFLQDAQLTVQESVRLMLSLAAGIDYLHTDIKSSVAKPGIAHRDMKSKNILIKTTGQGSQCCIADFGLAARSDYFDNLPDKKKFHFQVGTRRYMAPEILDSSINLTTFEGLKKADIYMVGLVLWEIGQRVSPGACPYQYPFQHDVPCDPTIDEMAAVVCDRKKRPTLPDSWSRDRSMVELSRLVCECWDSDPDARLTSLRVRKDLMRLLESLQRLRDSGCYFTDTSDQGFQSWD